MDVTTAVVTGAASGIGRALATALAARGARLVLADYATGPLREVAAALGARAVATDVSDHRAVEALARAVPDADLVCLNAGVLGPTLGSPWEAPPGEWESVLAVNLGGVVNGLRAFVPRLLAAGRPAHVLVTGSLAGLVAFPGGGAYAASKHAVAAVTEQAALALAGTPVGVSLLCPALVRSGMSPEGEDPADVAAQALAAVEDGRFAVVPEAWRGAVRARAERLAAGARPVLPAPQG